MDFTDEILDSDALILWHNIPVTAGYIKNIHAAKLLLETEWI